LGLLLPTVRVLLLLLLRVLRRGAIRVRGIATIGILVPIRALRGRLRLCLLGREESLAGAIHHGRIVT
jgi:hypothetical protein